MSEESSADATRTLQVSDVGLHDIGQRLIDLGEQLISIGKHTENHDLRQHIEEADRIAVEEAWDAVGREIESAVRRTLGGLSGFRKEYGNWERLIVEYALKRGFTQRDVARLLGVGLSTVNRWAQHPLTYDED